MFWDKLLEFCYMEGDNEEPPKVEFVDNIFTGIMNLWIKVLHFVSILTVGYPLWI